MPQLLIGHKSRTKVSTKPVQQPKKSTPSTEVEFRWSVSALQSKLEKQVNSIDLGTLDLKDSQRKAASPSPCLTARTGAISRTSNLTEGHSSSKTRSSSTNDVHKTKDTCRTPDKDLHEEVEPLSLKYSQLPRIFPANKSKETTKTNSPKIKQPDNHLKKYANKKYLSKLTSTSPRQQRIMPMSYPHLHTSHFKSVQISAHT